MTCDWCAKVLTADEFETPDMFVLEGIVDEADGLKLCEPCHELRRAEV